MNSMVGLLVGLVFVPPACELKSTAGGLVDPFRGAHVATVLYFLTEECPIARRFSPEMARISRDYAPKGIRFFAVHVDPATTLERARRHRDEFSLPFPGLLDPSHAAAKRVGVTTVPTAALYDVQGRLRYRGRIDDRYPQLGVTRKKPRKRELRMALDALLSGKTINPTRTESIGCVLPPPRIAGLP